jgi:hypothetical protein
MKHLLLAVLFLLASCATTKRHADVDEDPPETTATASTAPVKPAGPFNPKAYVAGYTPVKCEQAAREMLARSPDSAWAVLRECVNKGFGSIARLCDGAWDSELQTRKDAAVIIAKMIASRGGDVDGDLSAMRKHRIPLFSLQSAMEAPKTYLGRLVLARIRIDDLKEEAGKPTLRASEMSLGGSQGEVQRSDVVRAWGSTFSREHTVYHNAAVETGREVLLRLAKPDPFFEANKQFIVLARFEGVRNDATEGAEGEPTKVAIVTAVAYFEPSALVME